MPALLPFCVVYLCRYTLAALLIAGSMLHGSGAFAQRSSVPTAAPSTSQIESPAPAESDAPTMFPHPEDTRYFIAGQANIIFQSDGPFHSPYEGTNSFIGRGEYKTSLIGTMFLGYQLRKNPESGTDVIVDVESAGGRGLSEALGLAGFTNLDVVRNPNLGSAPYLARYQIHQIVGLSKKLIEGSRATFSLSDSVPERRLEFRIGKMSVPDFLDINSIGTDSHLQFMNWTVDNNGAFDYAADTRGYTIGAVGEYDDRLFSARYLLALMPTVANGIDLDYDLRRASGQNVELELRRGPLSFLKRYAPSSGEDAPAVASPNVEQGRHGAVRLLGYVNHAHMGLYRAATVAFLTGMDAKPDITKHEAFSAVKYGVGVNVEQELTSDVRAFARFGWNEGQHESFAYTEVDQTVEVGADYFGRAWGRPLDKLGLVFVSNAIKRDHQEYLRLGGLGFLLGDGRLNYAREDITEGYYNLHVWKGLYYALDGQFLEHPGYNRDRGPVLVESVRMHVDF